MKKGLFKTFICQQCGKTFTKWVTPSILKDKDNKFKFCSMRCVGKSQLKRHLGKCLYCKKEFTWSKRGGSIGKFCSQTCANRKNIRRKSQNPNWKGGITSIITKIRTSIKYINWRSGIFIRDNFTCQKCGEIGGRLNAHHIKSFYCLTKEIKECLPLYNLYDGAMIYTPLWDISNGITLCNKCHKLEHRKKK